VRAVLAQCHTVWVIGDPWEDGQIVRDDNALAELAEEIRNFCTVPGKPRPEALLARLDRGAPEPGPRKLRVRTRYLP